MNGEEKEKAEKKREMQRKEEEREGEKGESCSTFSVRLQFLAEFGDCIDKLFRKGESAKCSAIF